MRAPVGISPRVDLVFKAILGDPAHIRVLLDFLNAILAPHFFVSVTIENPASIATLRHDKEMVVDVRAHEKDGRIIQIEMRCLLHPALEERMLYGWADSIRRSLNRGRTTKPCNRSLPSGW